MKKIMCIILCAAMVFCVAGLSLSAEEGMEKVIGDVNGDGVFDVEDLLLVKKHVLKIAELVGGRFDAADVNYDGEVDVEDLLIMKKVILKVGEFPSKPTESTTEPNEITTESTTQEPTEPTEIPQSTNPKPEEYEIVKVFDNIVDLQFGNAQGYPFVTNTIRDFGIGELDGIDAIQFHARIEMSLSKHELEYIALLPTSTPIKFISVTDFTSPFNPVRQDSEVFWINRFGSSYVNYKTPVIDLNKPGIDKNDLQIEGFATRERYVTITDFVGLRKIDKID